MPPKKGKDGKGKEEKVDIQRILLEKDLEIATLYDKLSRLEKRSLSLTTLTEKQHIATKEMEEKLQDVISFLNGDVKEKEEKINALEMSLIEMKAESTKAIESLTRELNELKSDHKFVIEDLQIQLENAQVQLRDIDEFRNKKSAVEQEIEGLKQTIEREKKEHQDSMSDIERAALQEKEKLKKEMAIRIEETKVQMMQQMHEQLHAKTKKTIVENERLDKELGYHIRQTELLLTKNEKLVQENIELHRRAELAKEVQEDLALRNTMNQRSIRILLYKLRVTIERYQILKITQEPTSSCVQTENTMDTILNQSGAETKSSTEQAMKFLYACLEDVHVDNIHEPQIKSGEATEPVLGEKSSVTKTPNEFTVEEQQEFLMKLLRTAVSLRAVTGNVSTEKQQMDYQDFQRRNNFTYPSFDEIINLPLGETKVDEPVNKRTDKLVSSSAQTESMELEERLALAIREGLESCCSRGKY